MNAGVSIATPDFTGEVVQAKNAGADIMFVLLEKAACNRFFDATQRQGYAPIIIAPACVLQNMLDHKGVATNKVYAAHAAKPVLAGRSPAEDEALAAGKRFDPSLPLDGAFMFGWLAGQAVRGGHGPAGHDADAAGDRRRAAQAAGHRPRRAHPGAGLGPGNHAEGRCGMISKFDGERFVLLTPDFVC